MNMMKKAFTLTELLISMAVIGVVCAILIPIVFNIMPDQNTLMAKRAYYTVQSVISEMINDDACYPDKTRGSVGTNKASTVRRVGFDDGFSYTGCENWDSASYMENEGNADTKFKRLFAALMNSNDSYSKLTSGTYKTKDGMLWKVETDSENSFNSWYPASNASTKDGYTTIIVDVNGDKNPNCGQSEEATKCSSESNYDKFAMKVYVNGKIDILDDWANKAVDINKDVTEDN